MKRVLSKTNGLETTMEIDGDKTIITKTQDVETLLNFNKAMSNMKGKKITDECYNHAALIPPVIIVKWLQEEELNLYNPTHAERIKKKLNDPDYRFLRTSELNL